MRHVLLLTFPLYVLDQLTKLAIQRAIPFQSGVTVVPGFFDLVHVGNTGAAFGLGQGRSWFFAGVSAVVLVLLVVLAMRGRMTDGWSRVGSALLAAGILGNVTDRLRLGHVVDFLDFHVRGWHWPAFNVADSCICVAAACFVISSFRTRPVGAPA